MKTTPRLVAWTEYLRQARRMGDDLFAHEAANPPRCESAKAFREGVPLTECMEIARNVYRARTGQPVLDLGTDAVFQRAKEGHRPSLEIVAERLRSRAVRAGRERPVFLNEEESEDIAQEAVMRALKKLARVPEERNLVPFLLKMVHDMAIDLRRKQDREAKVIIFDSQLADIAIGVALQ